MKNTCYLEKNSYGTVIDERFSIRNQGIYISQLAMTTIHSLINVYTRVQCNSPFSRVHEGFYLPRVHDVYLVKISYFPGVHAYSAVTFIWQGIVVQ